MFRKLLKKKRVAAIGGVAALAITGIAVAYFTGGSGTVTGSGTVGSSTPWGITTPTPPTFSGNLTAIYPGAGTEFFSFTVKNNGNGNQSLAAITAAVSHDASGNVISNGNPVSGCLAAWFNATVDSGNPTLPSDLAPGGTYVGKIDLTMVDPTTPTNQDVCQGAAPAVTITAS